MNRFLLSLALVFCTLPSLADDLIPALDKILDNPTLRGGLTGAIVVRVSDRKALYTRNPDSRVTPASNRKLFTSAAALELLGDDFTIKTEAFAKSMPDGQGTLQGDLYLKGGGDGLLAPEDFENMAQQVAGYGVKHITGGIVGDGTLFTDGPYGDGWAWDYLSDYYAPQISALEISEGVLAVHVTAGAKPGDPVQYTVDQPTRYLPIVSTARTVAAGEPNTVTIYRPWDQNIGVIEGSLPVGGKADNAITVEYPARYAATVFQETLLRHGITVDGPAVMGRTPEEATTLLARHVSLPLSEYLKKLNKPSDNLLAESLERLVGVVKGKGGNYASGHAVETPFFQSLGIDTQTITLLDASGLARRDFVTVRAVSQLLLAMHEKKDWKFYYDSLPIAGVDGTLRRRMKGTKAMGNVHGKTGSLGEVSSLSGYVTGTDGQLYVFSEIMNNYPADSEPHTVQDEFANYLATHL